MSSWYSVLFVNCLDLLFVLLSFCLFYLIKHIVFMVFIVLPFTIPSFSAFGKQKYEFSLKKHMPLEVPAWPCQGHSLGTNILSPRELGKIPGSGVLAARVPGLEGSPYSGFRFPQWNSLPPRR